MFTELYKDLIVMNSLRIDRDIMNGLEAHLLLCYTGRSRTDLDLIDKQIRRYREGRLDALDWMHRAHRMAYEMKEALLNSRLQDFGDMLHESYMNKKQINPDITEGTPTDLLYETARRHGAISGKLLGAGGRGYLLLYCQTDRLQEVGRALEEPGGQFTDFAFDGLGLQVWRSQWR
jgi:D-glycero-alpha-D-manno-heptose-7-phosphate kinase